MTTLEAYLSNPCGKLSIPYWKARGMTVPPQIHIVHERDFSPEMLADHDDEHYFRLLHDLTQISADVPEGLHIETARQKDLPLIMDVINRSYTDLSVSLSQLEGYTRTPVYAPELWVLAKNDARQCVGCGIADCDLEAGEMILEWIQVLPEWRGRKIGHAIVNELLHRAAGCAQFATVSGKVDNPTRPERLYRRCGFTGSDVWHILRRK